MRNFAPALVAAIVVFYGIALPARADESCSAKLRAGLALQSFRITMTTEHGVETLDLVLPDRAHLTSTDGRMDLESIIIGTKRWIKIGGTWDALPDSDARIVDPLAKVRPPPDVASEPGSCVDLGATVYRGSPAHAYAFSHLSPGGSVRSEGTAYVMEDGYVHHVVSTFAGKTVGTMDLSDFNAVTVNPP